jgi:hypothetical protein
MSVNKNMKTFTIMLIAFACLFQFSCKKSDNRTDADKLAGSWHTKYIYTTTAANPVEYLNELFIFNADGTYEYKMYYSYGASTQAAGYISKQTGKYRVKNNAVEFTNISYYQPTNSTQKDAPENSLVIVTYANQSETWNYTFTSSNEMTFGYRCGPSELCMAAKTFKKL